MISSGVLHTGSRSSGVIRQENKKYPVLVVAKCISILPRLWVCCWILIMPALFNMMSMVGTSDPGRTSITVVERDFGMDDSGWTGVCFVFGNITAGASILSGLDGLMPAIMT